MPSCGSRLTRIDHRCQQSTLPTRVKLGPSGWLIEAGLADTALSVRPADLRRAIAVREALRAVLLAHNGAALVDAGAAGTLDAAASVFTSTPSAVRGSNLTPGGSTARSGDCWRSRMPRWPRGRGRG